MVVPTFYVDYDTTKAKSAGWITLVLLSLIFCSHSVYLFAVEDIKWVSDTLNVTNIIFCRCKLFYSSLSIILQDE
jgi:hypothetical protein